MKEVPAVVKFRGAALEWDEMNTLLIVPPLTLEGMEQVAQSVTDHDAMVTKDFNDLHKRNMMKVPVITMALKRNYPEITEEDVRSFLNGDNFDRAYLAALGLDRVSIKVKNLGELPPVVAGPTR